MVQRSVPLERTGPLREPYLTLSTLGAGAPLQQPVQRVVTIGLERPAPHLGCIVEGLGRSISGQIAVTLALEAVLRGASSESPEPVDIGVMIRDQFREANQAVYEYAHRMRAGAAIGASLLLWAIDGSRLVTGRSGKGEIYLLRGDSVTPLFAAGQLLEGTLDRFVGANAKVLVDLASTTLRVGDELLMVSGAGPVTDRAIDKRAMLSRLLCEPRSASERLASVMGGFSEPAAGALVEVSERSVQPAIELAIELEQPLQSAVIVSRSGDE